MPAGTASAPTSFRRSGVQGVTPWTGGLPACGGQGMCGGLQAIKDARWRKATGLVAAGGRKALRLYAAEKGGRGG